MKIPEKGEIRKPTKTISGITPVAVMLPPRKCKHGCCIYCPNLNVPQSYTPKSPVVLRASNVKYDSFKQVEGRLEAYRVMNHPVEKIELIIMGGTFLQYPKKFQYEFVKGCYDALNGKVSKTLEDAQKLNEKSKQRCVALCIETRPDVLDIKRMREFGCTRVELGVQIIDDKIYEKVKRGHTVQDVIDATKKLKDAGFKIGYHLMLNLPGVSFDKDYKMFKKIFSDDNFKPDQIKIYPCQVMPCSELEDLYWRKKYKPYDTERLASLLMKVKLLVPEYCRIMRVMREIPPDYIVAGTKKIDLRNIVHQEMVKLNKKCKCIRCREVGISLGKGKIINSKSIKLCRIDYNASEGKEIFLSFEDIKNNILIGLLRLRIPSSQVVKEINSETAVVREMHTYGGSLKVGGKDKNLWQHKGYGKLLLKEAEKIAKKEFGKNKLVVISGIGARKYFYDQSYKIDGTYVSKRLE
jgi:elongator complex protein 3